MRAVHPAGGLTKRDNTAGRRGSVLMYPLSASSEPLCTYGSAFSPWAIGIRSTRVKGEVSSTP
jgi:hypothetical protein